LIEQDEDGCYIVSCPQFKGCRSYGQTVEEAMENIKEAIELCLEDLSLARELHPFWASKVLLWR
jgi:predicted RNase H-like HicB family nuclease